MGNYMSAKGFVVTGILAVGFLGFSIGVPSSDMVYSRAGTQPATFSYFGACTTTNQYTQTCQDLYTDFYHCALGETPGASAYTYSPLFTSAKSPWVDFNAAAGASNFLDVSSCRSMTAAEAVGVIAIVLSGLSLIAAIFHEKGRLGAGLCGLLASLFGVIALAVFFSVKPDNLNNAGAATGPANPSGNKSLSDFVSTGVLGLGYSTGLQVVGILASAVGGILAFTGDFGPTGGEGASSARPTAAIHHPQSSTAGTEMH